MYSKLRDKGEKTLCEKVCPYLKYVAVPVAFVATMASLSDAKAAEGSTVYIQPSSYVQVSQPSVSEYVTPSKPFGAEYIQSSVSLPSVSALNLEHKEKSYGSLVGAGLGLGLLGLAVYGAMRQPKDKRPRQPYEY